MAANTIKPDPSGLEMVANRLAKNNRRLGPWLRREQINAWRCYDADIPEYAAAIDLYDTLEERWLVVQEYQPGKAVDEGLAALRLQTLVDAARRVYAVPAERCAVKVRRRQKGAAQYQRSADPRAQELFVREGPALLAINPTDYLDTGLFLDHRPVRRLVHANAAGKRFLNLFSYTSSVTVHAALGGASESLSIDLSNTYLDWSRRNFRANKLDPDRHRLKKADCVTWLGERAAHGESRFDLIFLDPPSFSNSSSMAHVLDIQRDHESLVRQCMQLLDSEGMLVFSNNLRSFSLAPSLVQDFSVKDYCQQSLDRDFERNPRIHHCFLLKHRQQDFSGLQR